MTRTWHMLNGIVASHGSANHNDSRAHGSQRHAAAPAQMQVKARTAEQPTTPSRSTRAATGEQPAVDLHHRAAGAEEDASAWDDLGGSAAEMMQRLRQQQQMRQQPGSGGPRGVQQAGSSASSIYQQGHVTAAGEAGGLIKSRSTREVSAPAPHAGQGPTLQQFLAMQQDHSMPAQQHALVSGLTSAGSAPASVQPGASLTDPSTPNSRDASGRHTALKQFVAGGEAANMAPPMQQPPLPLPAVGPAFPLILGMNSMGSQGSLCCPLPSPIAASLGSLPELPVVTSTDSGLPTWANLPTWKSLDAAAMAMGYGPPSNLSSACLTTPGPIAAAASPASSCARLQQSLGSAGQLLGPSPYPPLSPSAAQMQRQGQAQAQAQAQQLQAVPEQQQELEALVPPQPQPAHHDAGVTADVQLVSSSTAAGGAAHQAAAPGAREHQHQHSTLGGWSRLQAQHPAQPNLPATALHHPSRLGPSSGHVTAGSAQCPATAAATHPVVRAAVHMGGPAGSKPRSADVLYLPATAQRRASAGFPQAKDAPLSSDTLPHGSTCKEGSTLAELASASASTDAHGQPQAEATQVQVQAHASCTNASHVDELPASAAAAAMHGGPHPPHPHSTLRAHQAIATELGNIIAARAQALAGLLNPGVGSSSSQLVGEKCLSSQDLGGMEHLLMPPQGHMGVVPHAQGAFHNGMHHMDFMLNEGEAPRSLVGLDPCAPHLRMLNEYLRNLSQEGPSNKFVFVCRHPLGMEGCRMLASFLATTPGVRAVALAHAGIDDDGAAELAAGLRAAPGLWLVDLRHNNISDRGATALAECLAAPGTGSSAGGISGGYAAAASAAAARSRRSSAGPALCASLRELVLSNNVIGDEGVLVLAEALAISSAARRVRIGNNPAGPASLRELAAAHKSRGLRRSRSRLSNASLNQPVQQLMAPPAQPGLDLGVVGRMAGAGTKSPSPGLFGALDMAGGAAESGDEEGGLSRLRVRTQGDAANAGVPHTSAHPLSPKHHPLLHQDPELGRLCALVRLLAQPSLPAELDVASAVGSALMAADPGCCTPSDSTPRASGHHTTTSCTAYLRPGSAANSASCLLPSTSLVVAGHSSAGGSAAAGAAGSRAGAGSSGGGCPGSGGSDNTLCRTLLDTDPLAQGVAQGAGSTSSAGGHRGSMGGSATGAGAVGGNPEGATAHNPYDLEYLADALSAHGYDVSVTSAQGGGQVGDCLQNLRHRFATVLVPHPWIPAFDPADLLLHDLHGPYGPMSVGTTQLDSGLSDLPSLMASQEALAAGAGHGHGQGQGGAAAGLQQPPQLARALSLGRSSGAGRTTINRRDSAHCPTVPELQSLNPECALEAQRLLQAQQQSLQATVQMLQQAYGGGPTSGCSVASGWGGGPGSGQVGPAAAADAAAGVAGAAGSGAGAPPSASRLTGVSTTAGTPAPREARIIVDPSFREQFEIGKHATEAYEALVAALPRVYVGFDDRLPLLVELLCDEMAAAFKERSVPVPPWRRAHSLISKWRPRAQSHTSLALPPASAPAVTGAHGAGNTLASAAAGQQGGPGTGAGGAGGMGAVSGGAGARPGGMGAAGAAASGLDGMGMARGGAVSMDAAAANTSLAGALPAGLGMQGAREEMRSRLAQVMAGGQGNWDQGMAAWGGNKPGSALAALVGAHQSAVTAQWPTVPEPQQQLPGRQH